MDARENEPTAQNHVDHKSRWACENLMHENGGEQDSLRYSGAAEFPQRVSFPEWCFPRYSILREPMSSLNQQTPTTFGWDLLEGVCFETYLKSIAHRSAHRIALSRAELINMSTNGRC